MALSNRSKVFVTSGVIFAIIASVVLFIAITARRPEEPAQKKQLITPEAKRNMMVSQEDRLNMIRDFNHRTGKRINMSMRNLELNYTFSPAFLNRLEQVSASQNAENVKAISTLCNLSEVPPTVYVYDLKSHWLVGESKTLALEYGVDSISYSQPTETTTYQYLFIRPDNTAAFTQYESSGVYTYTRSSTLAAGSLNGEGLRRYTNQILAQHQLDKNLNPPTYRTWGEVTDFAYRRNLYDFMLVDEASIQSFFDQENCAISESDIMGLITVGAKNNGEIVKLVNNTRTANDAYKMNTITIQQAELEYRNAQPLDPIVFPANAEIDPARPVTIDAAVIAYYDVGLNFAQHLYIPVYIAHGFTKSTTGQDVQILTFFPAVAANELAQKGLVRVVPEPGDESTQQQGTFGFATPTPHAPPPYSGQKPEFGVSGPGCPGNVVDHMVSCSVEGRIICRGSFAAPAANDPMKACEAGCSGRVAVIDVTAGTNPCDAIMKQNGITGDKINGEVPRQRIAPDGEVSCVITACPS